MVWIEVREMVDEKGVAIGRYRLTRRTDDPVSGPFPLCDCPGGHATRIEADQCAIARPRAEKEW